MGALGGFKLFNQRGNRMPDIPPKKYLSGAQQRKKRVARGRARNLPSDVRCRRKRDIRRQKKRQRLWSIRSLAYVSMIKLERGCADCGYRGHPAALDFDHLPGTEKRGAVSVMCRKMCIKRADLDAEIVKCEVVCANCHRIRTYNRPRRRPVPCPSRHKPMPLFGE
jgi:hypothetical protein